MTDDDQAPDGVDVTTPSVARMYDYFLGGKDNYTVDRAAAAKVMQAAPTVAQRARENRAFLGRAVRHMAESGIHQFIDLGTGLPTQDNVHQVAQRANPGARVVYVDNDPIVAVHGRALLTHNGQTTIIQADMRNAAEILDDPALNKLIDLNLP